MKNIDKSKAIDCIIERLIFGNSIPCVSGGQGGSGFKYYYVCPDSNEFFDKLKSDLEKQRFTSNPKLAVDFERNLVLDDYEYSVQFSKDDGSWVQMLLW